MKKDIKEERGECNWGKVRFRVKLYEELIEKGDENDNIEGWVVRWKCKKILMGWR